MAHHDETPHFGLETGPISIQERIPLRSKGRKFFQQMQPTFAVDLPRTTTRLQFLDENDPAKDTVVRKKAREWVNMNRKLNRSKQKTSDDRKSPEQSNEFRSSTNQLQRRRISDAAGMGSPTTTVGSHHLDPFNILPDIGRDYKNIIEFFLHGCPEELPCSDDKYSQGPSQELISFRCDNTILGNMAKSKVSFIVWLYATVSIRNGMMGSFNSEEVRWFYNQALKAIQTTLQREVEAGVYSDHLLNAMGCITATALFSGMFDTAVLHRDATVRVLAFRGGGDILEGIKSVAPFTAKALQWCEMMVSTQLMETPTIPYYHAVPCLPLPYDLVHKSERRTADTLSSLPALSQPTQYIVRLLHQLGIAYADPHPVVKVDSYIIRSLYDVEYTLLQVLESHKIHGVLSDVEALLVEAFQMYFWFGHRMLVQQTRLADVLVSRLMNALLPFIFEGAPKDVQPSTMTAGWFASTHPMDPDFTLRTLHHSRPTNNVIAWSLMLGTKITARLNGPEHLWLKELWRLYMQALELAHDDAPYQRMLEIFPDTHGFPCIALDKLVMEMQT